MIHKSALFLQVGPFWRPGVSNQFPFGLLGCSLERSWVPLGASEGPFGVAWELLGVSLVLTWAYMGRPWDPLRIDHDYIVFKLLDSFW